MREALLSLPPRIKVYEAAGSLADGRVKVTMRGDGRIEAVVVSSGGDRRYTVIVEDRGDDLVHAYSDDNGTRYRRYIGYPIIAVMMLHGLLPRNHRVEKALRGVPWKSLNERYRRYAIVERIALERAEKRGVPRDEVIAYVDEVMEELARLRVVYDEGLVRERKTGLERFL